MNLRRNKMNLGLLIGLLAFMVSCTSNAQSKDSKERGQKPPSVEEIFKMMDADEDGKLTKEEVKGPLKRDFSKIDTDEDGFITKEELEKAPKPERKDPPNREQ
ncbi:EF-hand domain-containing protein [uncultured Aquimarina sp.]|uniref:EF-hand domain-containing protein n=1 Tax=uncultured Aquimarina sp. TaxID=575652 RepID=UPI00262C13F4|nr:EF-hand domain-containing protein [uncultured Aquimarina sp.]